MTISDGIMILAVLLAPLLAVQVQKWIERLQESRRRKHALFQALMATRTARVSIDHVHALNAIDLEFYGRRFLGMRWTSERENAVVNAWHKYRDALGDPDNFRDDVGLRRREDAFIGLLFAMARDVGYDFDEVHLRRSAYSPQAHGDLELDQWLLRKRLVELMEGKRAINVLSVTQDDVQRATNELPPTGTESNAQGQVHTPLTSESPSQ